MKTALNKNEKIVIAFVLFAVVAMTVLFTQVNFKQKAIAAFDAVNFINYEMARPEEAFSEYSLNGRDVDHTYEGITLKAAVTVKAADQVKLAAITKADLKKKEAAAAAAALKAKKVQAAVAPAITPVAKAVKTTTPVAPFISKKDDLDSATSNNNSGYRYAQTQVANQEAAAEDGVANPKDPKDVKKKTYSQWRAQIFATPTRETLLPFIEAYRKTQVSATEYQSMSQDLLDQPEEKYKGLGIMALRAVPSLPSLSQLTHLNKEALSQALQVYLNQAILAYLQPQNVGILNQALATKDKVLVMKSLQLLNSNLPKLSQGDYTAITEARFRRDSEATTFSMNSFKSLIPTLGTLSSSADPELATLAQQSSSLILSANTIAQQ